MWGSDNFGKPVHSSRLKPIKKHLQNGPTEQKRTMHDYVWSSYFDVVISLYGKYNYHEFE